MSSRRYIILWIEPGDRGIMKTLSRYGRQVWVVSKLRSRAGDPCAQCGNPVGAVAYRPLTNKQNRMDRICFDHEVDKNIPSYYLNGGGDHDG